MLTSYQIMSKVKEWQESGKWGYLFGASGQKFTRDVYEQFLASAEGKRGKGLGEVRWPKCCGLLWHRLLCHECMRDERQSLLYR